VRRAGAAFDLHLNSDAFYNMLRELAIRQLVLCASLALFVVGGALAQTELNIPDNLGKRFVIGFGPNFNNAQTW